MAKKQSAAAVDESKTLFSVRIDGVGEREIVAIDEAAATAEFMAYYGILKTSQQAVVSNLGPAPESDDGRRDDGNDSDAGAATDSGNNGGTKTDL